MTDIDLPATKRSTVILTVILAAGALLLLWAGYQMLTGGGPETLARWLAFGFIGLIFNRCMRLLQCAFAVLHGIRAVDKARREVPR